MNQCFKPMSRFGFSIVIIVLNEERYISACLERLVAQQGVDAPWEIVVVDGGSCDKTIQKVQVYMSKCHRIRLLSTKPGYGRQRNSGVLASRYEYVVFLSADVLVPRHWLAEIALQISTEQVDVIIGEPKLIPEGSGFSHVLPGVARSVYVNILPEAWIVECFSTVFVVVARDLLLRNPFDEDLGACEDKDLALRLLNSASFSRYLGNSYHLARERPIAFLHKILKESQALPILRGRNKIYLLSWRWDFFGWGRHLILSVFILLTLVVFALWFRQPWYLCTWLVLGNIHFVGLKRVLSLSGVRALVAILPYHIMSCFCIKIGLVWGFLTYLGVGYRRNARAGPRRKS